jgi:hypothetical protein
MPSPLSRISQALTAARCWGATAEEVEADYPCDSLMAVPVLRLHRAIEIHANRNVIYRWVCQLKVAPYSYDLLDNRGRRSPRHLTPGVENLAIGQRWMVFSIVDFEPGVHVTGEVLPGPRRIFGQMASTYVIRPRSDSACRLVVRLNIAAATGLRQIVPTTLAWGDLIMMRKQLLTIKQLAERTHVNEQSSVRFG